MEVNERDARYVCTFCVGFSSLKKNRNILPSFPGLWRVDLWQDMLSFARRLLQAGRASEYPWERT